MGKIQIKKQVSRSETWLKGVVFHPFIKPQTPKKGIILKEIRKQNAVFLGIQKHPPNIQIKVQKTFRKCCLLFPNVFWTFGKKRKIKRGFKWEFFSFVKGSKLTLLLEPLNTTNAPKSPHPPTPPALCEYLCE